LKSPTAFRSLVCLACFVAASASRSSRGDDLVPLLPDSTAAYVATDDAAAALAAWNRTLYAQWFASAPMQPFVERLRAQGADPSAAFVELWGLGLADVDTLKPGPTIVALTANAEKRPRALLIVGAAAEAGEKMAALVDQRRRQAGFAARSEATTAGPVTIYTGTGETPTHYVARTDRLFVAGDDLAAVTQVLERAKAPPTVPAAATAHKLPQLADLPGPKETHLRFRIIPAAIDAVQFATPKTSKKSKREKTPPFVQMGFDGLRSIEGSIVFGAGEYDVFYRLAVLAPQPRQKGMQLLGLVNTAAKAPPAWLPQQFGTLSLVGYDAAKLLDGIAAPFDILAADGEEGTFEDVVASYRDDPLGPGVDLRKELFARLGSRVTLFGDYVEPFGPSCERNLVAVDVSAAKDLRGVITRLVQDDPDVFKRTIAGQTIWEVQPSPSKDNPQEKLPKLAVGIAHDHLIIATHVELLEKVLTAAAGGPSPAADETFRTVTAQLDRLSPGDACLRICARTDHDYRVTYELARTGRLAESESIYGLLMRGFVKERQEAGGAETTSLLPPFDAIRSFLAPVGMIGTAHDDGFTLVGFTLRSGAAAPGAPAGTP
jgi:hypothetical protein